MMRFEVGAWQTQAPNLSEARVFAFVALHLLLRLNSDRARAAIAEVGEVCNCTDGGSLYIYQPGELPARIDRLDVHTGQRKLSRQLIPSDPAGVETIGPILMTPDAKTCVFGYHRMLADLYLVEGLK